jgi:hypothetical protein
MIEGWFIDHLPSTWDIVFNVIFLGDIAARNATNVDIVTTSGL